MLVFEGKSDDFLYDELDNRNALVNQRDTWLLLEKVAMLLEDLLDYLDGRSDDKDALAFKAWLRQEIPILERDYRTITEFLQSPNSSNIVYLPFFLIY